MYLCVQLYRIFLLIKLKVFVRKDTERRSSSSRGGGRDCCCVFYKNVLLIALVVLQITKQCKKIRNEKLQQEILFEKATFSQEI